MAYNFLKILVLIALSIQKENEILKFFLISANT